MADEEQDKEFVEFVLKTIVDNPDDVNVDRTIDEMGVLISVTVNPDDMGKVIGKSGQTAKAVRTLLKVVGAKHDARVNMKIIEPEGSEDKAAAASSVAQSTDAGQQGSTAGADEVPVDETSAGEAVAEQVQTDAAQEQPSENNAVVDEATGNVQPEEPVTQQEEEPPAETPDDLDKAKERSPLDDL